MDGNPTSRRLPLKSRRLHKPYMYKKVFEGGKALRGSPLTLRYFRADQDCSRVGFIIRKKAGDAPMRNSIRRTLRRCFQELLPEFGEGTWVIFDVSDKVSASSRSHVKGEADRLLRAVAATVAATASIASTASAASKAPGAGSPSGGKPA